MTDASLFSCKWLPDQNLPVHQNRLLEQTISYYFSDYIGLEDILSSCLLAAHSHYPASAAASASVA